MRFWDLFFGKRTPRRLGPSVEAAAPQEPAVPAPLASSAKPLPTRRLTVEKAVELMRTLPFDDGGNSDLVLRVMRKTLQSSGVSVPEIVESAKARELELSTASDAARVAIEQLEREIVTRREGLAAIEHELGETRDVRERLEDAIANETQLGIPVLSDEGAPPPTPAAAATSVDPPG